MAHPNVVKSGADADERADALRDAGTLQRDLKI
jgi:hypothetical protein